MQDIELHLTARVKESFMVFKGKTSVSRWLVIECNGNQIAKSLISVDDDEYLDVKDGDSMSTAAAQILADLLAKAARA